MSEIDANAVVDQAIADLDAIEAAIEEQGVEVEGDTPTNEYGKKILAIPKGGDVDQAYNPESENAQSGIAVAEAMATLPIKLVESPDKDGNKIDIYSMESGTYILSGKFIPYPNATSTFTFSSGQLVAIRHGTVSTVAQVFYPPNNAIQYLDIRPDETNDKGYSYTRNDAKLVNMESIANKTNSISDDLTDEHYPTAFAVKGYVDGLDGHIRYIESLDAENIVNLRDLETGNYVLYGYFSPYANSQTTMTADNSFVNVYHIDEWSHIFCFEPLNAKVVFIEILADDNASGGHIYNRTIIDMLELNGLIYRVGTLETQVGDFETALDTAIALCDTYINGGVQ